MGNIRSFSALRISVENVTESTKWYKNLFQMEPTEQSDRFTSFKISGVALDIVLADSKSPVTNGGCVGYWLTDDLESLIENAKQLGAVIYRGPLNVQEIQKTIVQIQDPLGNILGFEGQMK